MTVKTDREILELCAEALESVDSAERNDFINRLTVCKRVFIFGVGRSGLIGQAFSVRLVQLGFTVYFVGDMTTPVPREDDLTVLVSNTGMTMSVVRTAEIARRIGSHVISVTSNIGSDLALASDSTILIATISDAEKAPLGTVFEDSVLLFFDGLVPDLMNRLGINEEDMRNHHAIWV